MFNHSTNQNMSQLHSMGFPDKYIQQIIPLYILIENFKIITTKI